MAIPQKDPGQALAFDRNVVNLAAALYELSGNTRLWLATSRTSGNLLTSGEKLLLAFLREAADRLARDGFVP